jgi:hypothetical protein
MALALSSINKSGLKFRITNDLIVPLGVKMSWRSIVALNFEE